MISVKPTFSSVNNLFFYFRMELAYVNMQTVLYLWEGYARFILFFLAL